MGFPIANDPVYGPSDYQKIHELKKEEPKYVDETAVAQSPEKEELEKMTVSICVACQTNDCYAGFSNEQVQSHGIYLHSFRYSSSEWTFHAPRPAWAAESYIDKIWKNSPL